MHATASLREQIETLQEENRQLRALKLPTDGRFLNVGFTRNERMIMAALMDAKGVCSRVYLLDCLAFTRGDQGVEPKSMNVVIHRIRRKLDALGFPGAIKNEFSDGWRFVDKARLQAFFEEGH